MNWARLIDEWDTALGTHRHCSRDPRPTARTIMFVTELVSQLLMSALKLDKSLNNSCGSQVRETHRGC